MLAIGPATDTADIDDLRLRGLSQPSEPKPGQYTESYVNTVRRVCAQMTAQKGKEKIEEHASKTRMKADVRKYAVLGCDERKSGGIGGLVGAVSSMGMHLLGFAFPKHAEFIRKAADQAPALSGMYSTFKNANASRSDAFGGLQSTLLNQELNKASDSVPQIVDGTEQAMSNLLQKASSSN